MKAVEKAEKNRYFLLAGINIMMVLTYIIVPLAVSLVEIIRDGRTLKLLTESELLDEYNYMMMPLPLWIRMIPIGIIIMDAILMMLDYAKRA